MKKYLFLFEKISTMYLFKDIYEKNKKDFDLEPTFTPLNAICCAETDKAKKISHVIPNKKLDVSNYSLPNIFYILGDNILEDVAKSIKINNYDEIVFVTKQDIRSGLLIEEFAKIKKIDMSSINATKIKYLTEKNVYAVFNDINNCIITCDKFLLELIEEFKRNN